MSNGNSINKDSDHDLHDHLVSGLLYTHLRLNDGTKKTLEASSFLYALIELLNEKGIISIEELDGRKKEVAGRLVQKFADSGIGLMYQDQEFDKYAFEQEAKVDCEACLHICKAACCKMPFALSKQDVDEGIIQWEFGRPYMIAHGEDGYCIHLDRNTYQCSVHEHRPVPCRGFDCRDNEKWPVWSDYEGKVLNVELNDKIDGSRKAFYQIPK
jgi:Fe-S-cluster containining protein